MLLNLINSREEEFLHFLCLVEPGARFAVAELQRAAESTELPLAQTISSCCCSGQLFLTHTGQGETEGKDPKVKLGKETLQLSSALSVSPRAVWRVESCQTLVLNSTRTHLCCSVLTVRVGIAP